MEPIDPALVGRRIEAIYTALGIKKAHFADAVGIDRSSFTKIVKGDKPLLPRDAWRIYQLYGVDLNFIYGGQLVGLPPNLSSKLTQILKNLSL